MDVAINISRYRDRLIKTSYIADMDIDADLDLDTGTYIDIDIDLAIDIDEIQM